jgi:outer membrane protein TolC
MAAPEAGDARDRSQASSPVDINVVKRWQALIEHPQLMALIQQALTNNPEQHQYQSRIEQAEALLKSRRAQDELKVEIATNYSHQQTKRDGFGAFGLDGRLSYELDIWGRRDASQQAALLAWQAASYQKRVAEIALTSDMVQSWIEIVALQREQALLQQQVKTNQTILQLQKSRLAGGVARVLDVLQQQEVLAQTQALLPDIESRLALAKHRLQLLTGSPSTPIDTSDATYPEFALTPEAGVTSDILYFRPDIEAAWRQYHQGEWLAEARRDERWPTFELSAVLSSGGASVSDLIEEWVLRLVASATYQVWDGGEQSAQELLADAQAREKYHIYRQRVQQAIYEIHTSQLEEHYQRQALAKLQKQRAAADAVLKQAELSYASGEASYVNVLNGLLSVQSLTRRHIEEQKTLVLHQLAWLRATGLATESTK